MPASVDSEKLPHIPDRVGRYDILLPIASGGMATVYLARMSGVGGFERDVALKLTHAHLLESEGFSSDLIEEAKLASQIKHPNVVATLDVGEDRLGVYLVMDYVEGDSLAGLRRRAKSSRERLPARIGLPILLDALAGLQAAHELRDPQGRLLDVVHRDFSPQNILVGLDGIGRLTDFGIAKAASRLGHTATGLIKGKLPYVAPEQARGQVLDRRCDVWAAGVIAWELLTGKRLYRKANDVELLLRLVTETPALARDVRPEVPADLSEVVAQALTLDRDERFRSAADFAQALRAASRGGDDLAEPEERADYVKRVVGPKVGQRRARVDELWKLRARVGELSREDSSGTLVTPDSDQRIPVVARPLAGNDSGISDVVVYSARPTVEVDAAPEPAGVDDQETLDSPTAAASSEASPAEPGGATDASHLDDAETVDAETATAPAAIGGGSMAARAVEPPVEPTQTDTTSVSESALLALAARRRSWRVPAVVGAAVLLLVGGGVAFWGSQPDEASGTASTTGQSPPVTAADGMGRSSSDSVADSSSESSATVAALDAGPGVTPSVSVEANGRIKWLEIGGHAVKIDSPSRALEADLPELQPGTRVKVKAKALDGRRATTSFVVGDETVSIRFPVGARPRLRPSPASPIPDSPYSR